MSRSLYLGMQAAQGVCEVVTPAGNPLATRRPATYTCKVPGQCTHGNLSNQQAADIARAVNHLDLRHVVAAHLSERNNRPALAQAALGDALGWLHTAIGVADPLRGTDWVEV